MRSVRNHSTFATLRIERIIGRVFSTASVATSLETLANAFPETGLINPQILYFSIGLILLAQLSAVFTFWFGSANSKIYLLHGAAYAVAFILYPFSVSPLAQIPDGFRPWLWWATGTATMAMGMYLTKWWSVVYLGFVPTSWFFLRVLPIGGSGNLGSATLDAIYIVLYPAAVLTLVGMLRTAALGVDRKNDEVAEVAAIRAEVDATELERQKLDDLVHDQVLTTLLLAAKAETVDARRLATESAEVAIARLQSTASENPNQIEEISSGTFFDSLSASLRRGFPEVEIMLFKEAEFQVPISVGIAIADATIQAMTNSMQHAGKNSNRQIRLKADNHGIKVVVKDDGKGFRESKIPKNRLGVRNSIRRRVTAAGGEVVIDSAPRKGAAVILKWGPNA